MLTPQQQIDAARLDQPESELALIALDRVVPWIRIAGTKPGAITHHGLRMLPIADSDRSQVVHMLTVQKPGKSALVAIYPSGKAWRVVSWANRHPPNPVA